MSEPPALVLGVDAGNSKTVAVVADHTGAVLGVGRAGNGDIYGAASEQAAVDAVVAAADAALTAAFGTADHHRLRHASFCLAGLDWASDTEFWSAALDLRYPGLSRSLHNDGFALLRAGSPGGDGVALSAETGGAVVSRHGSAEWTASFWIRDPMGGGALGMATFDAVVRADLGIAPATSLTQTLLAHLGYADVETMLEATTRRGGVAPGYAALARDVLDAAASGDAVAGEIVEDQGRTLALYAVAAAARVGLPLDGDFPVVLGGSVLASDRVALREATIRALERVLPASRPQLSEIAPILGAVGEAITEAVGSLDRDVYARLSAHTFAAGFLST